MCALDGMANHRARTPCLLAAGLSLRLGWALLIPVVPVSDSGVYDQFAVRLAQGVGYTWLDGSPSAFWPVGTAAVYGLLYRLFGVHHTVIVALNLLLFVAILLISMRLAERWFGKGTAAITGLLIAVWPLHIEFTTVLASELIFTALVLAIVWAWEADGPRPAARGVLLGVLLAAASYVRPTAMLLTLVLLLGAAVRGQGRSRLGAAICSLMVAAMLIAPWSVRNSRAFDRFVLLSTNGGVTLWMGNNPDSAGGYAEVPPAFSNIDEAERNERMGAVAKTYILAEPGRFAVNSLRRLRDTFGRETIGVAWNKPGIARALGPGAVLPLKLVSQAFWLAALALGLAGVALLAASCGLLRAGAHPAALVWLYFAGIHAVVISQDRYHFPVTPLIAAFAGLAICTALRTPRLLPSGAQGRAAPASSAR